MVDAMTTGMRYSMATTMLCCYLLTVITMLANGQVYHFSQGWLPGRKRASPATADDESTLARLLQTEYKRLTAVKPSIDDNDLQSSPFAVISDPSQHRIRLLRLVCR